MTDTPVVYVILLKSRAIIRRSKNCNSNKNRNESRLLLSDKRELMPRKIEIRGLCR
jgi:hypothetical protein